MVSTLFPAGTRAFGAGPVDSIPMSIASSWAGAAPGGGGGIPIPGGGADDIGIGGGATPRTAGGGGGGGNPDGSGAGVDDGGGGIGIGTDGRLVEGDNGGSPPKSAVGIPSGIGVPSGMPVVNAGDGGSTCSCPPTGAVGGASV